ncbi:MAG: spore maturation protein [Bacteroides sp.]|nr:spore maturation protein [Bacteroides sp.]MCM1550632.1 spore maturation protein [Clostridium sp.]
MKLISMISSFMIPLTLFYIIGYGLLNREKVYDIFIEGVKEGFKIVIGIAPTLVGLMVAVGVIRASGVLDMAAKLLTPVGELVKIPAQVLPVILVRLFSTSAANGLVFDLFKEYGTDSGIGLTASIVMSCTESIFYIMSVYFLSVKVKKTRWTLAGGLLATLAGVAASVVIANMMLGA